MKDLRSPLAKVKGLGSSPDASNFFWVRQVTAVALIPLVLWFTFSIAFLPEANYETIVNWLQSPFNTVMMVLLVLVGFQHGKMGIQVIIEDYVSCHSKRVVSVLAVNFVSYFMMALGVFSVIKIALGGH